MPTSITPLEFCYTLAERQKVAELCDKYHVTLIEDAPYSELRFSGENLPTISSFCKHSTFILRSFSKSVAPGMRLGVVQSSIEHLVELTKLKQITDLHSNLPLQYVLCKLLVDPKFKQHLINLRHIYKSKHDLMIKCLRAEFSNRIQVSDVEGGMFIWLTFSKPLSIDMMCLARQALQNKLAVVPGSVFSTQSSDTQALRLNFSHTPLEEILKVLSV